MKKINFLFFFLIFTLFIYTASAESPSLGYNENIYGDTLFNINLLTPSPEGRSLSAPMYNHIVADLDEDGDLEIAGIDGVILKVWELNPLTLKSQVSMACFSSKAYTINPLIAHDIDQDGDLELIISCPDLGAVEDIYFYNYNGSLLNLETTNANAFPATMIEGRAIGCAEDQCLMYGHDTSVGRMLHFNKTYENDFYYNGGTKSFITTMPKVTLKDIDADGMLEGVLITSTGTTWHEVYLEVIELDDILTESQKCEYFPDLYNYAPVVTAQKDFTLRNLVTSPTVYDFTADIGLEIAIGIMTSLQKFELRLFDQNCNLLDTFPSVTDADGEILSNPFPCNILPDTDVSNGDHLDACLLGHDDDADELTLLVGNSESLWLDSDILNYDTSVTFGFDVEKGWNSTDMQSGTIHAVQTETEGNDLDEIVTPYGIFTADIGAFDSDLVLNWFSPITESAYILPQDIDNDGQAEITAYTNTAIYVFDDGFTNSPGEILGGTYNPCPNSVLKLNTTIETAFVVIDIDNDGVCANATMYYDESFKQDSETVCDVSGTIFPFQFILNVTGSHTLIMRGWDTENNETIDTLTKSVNIANNGLEFNDEICSFSNPGYSGYIPPGGANESISGITDPEVNNSLTQGVNQINTTLGVGTTIIWILIMIGCAFGVIFGLKDMPNSTAIIIPVLAIIELLMFIVGIKQGYISTGMALLVGFGLVVGIGIWVSKKFMGHDTVG